MLTYADVYWTTPPPPSQVVLLHVCPHTTIFAAYYMCVLYYYICVPSYYHIRDRHRDRQRCARVVVPACMRLPRQYLYFCTSKASKLTQEALAGNIVRGNEGGGAVVTGYSAPVFSEDQFSHNGFVAVGVKEHSTVLNFFFGGLSGGWC